MVVYMKKEMMLRSPQRQLTYPTSSYHPGYLRNLRELQFILDDARPCVWWDWWTDPASDICLLQCEFKMLVRHIPVRPRTIGRSWISSWPFQCPVWHHVKEERARNWPEYMQPAEMRRRGDFAMQRANRRLYKRYAKSTHSKGLRGAEMSGSWRA